MALRVGWRVLAAGMLVLVSGAGAQVDAQVFMTQEEALDLAFPGASSIERKTAFLNDQQSQGIMELAGTEVDRRVVTYYAAHDGDGWTGAAYFDAHRVRTLDEVLMIVVDRDGRVGRIEVLKFAEPPDYLAPEGWVAQFVGEPLSDDLSLKGDIVNITGATLTSQAVTEAVRRTLALHAVIEPFSGPPPS